MFQKDMSLSHIINYERETERERRTYLHLSKAFINIYMLEWEIRVYKEVSK